MKERQADQPEDYIRAVGVVVAGFVEQHDEQAVAFEKEEQRIDAALEPVIGVLEIWKAIRS